MRIAVDAMGGDNAPFINVEGALQYLRDARHRNEVVLVGDPAVIEPELARLGEIPPGLTLEKATQTVGMADSPTRSFKEKPDSSLHVGLGLVKEGKAEAFLSAGNTGAVMAFSLLLLGRIPGVDRPCVGAFMPHEKGPTLLLDVGAQSAVKPKNLLQFGIMGRIVYEKILKRENARVALLSIGEEAVKGTPIVKEADRLLKASTVNYIGYAEGRDIFTEKADVIVTDGFTGNVALKLAESTFRTLFSMIRNRLSRPRHMLGARLIKPIFTELFRIFDPNNYGGSPLLGVKGISLICHGSSTPTAIKNALFEAQRLITTNLIKDIETEISASLENITYNDLDNEVLTH